MEIMDDNEDLPFVRIQNIKNIKHNQYIYCGRPGRGMRGGLGNMYVDGTSAGKYFDSGTSFRVHSTDLVKLSGHNTRPAIDTYRAWFRGSDMGEFGQAELHNVRNTDGLFYWEVKELLVSHCVSLFQRGFSTIILGSFAYPNPCHCGIFKDFLDDLFATYPEIYHNNYRQP